MKRTLVFSLLILGFSTAAQAVETPKEIIEKDLARFQKNSVEFMQSLPRKLRSRGNTVDFDTKVQVRELILSRGQNSFKADIPGSDNIQQLLEMSDVMTNLKEMEAASLTRGKVAVQPWSDDYWPIKKGILGNRYTDPEFRKNSTWDEYNKYIEAHPLKEIFESLDQARINQLGPAEKYDLLFFEGIPFLSKVSWLEGKRYWDEKGEVESWMGICHGWAAASYMLPRPTNKIDVMAADGKTLVSFYPSDIKALASLLWAKVRTPTAFLGGRCNDKDPSFDEHGRMTSEDCFDINPGTWHISLINKVGRAKESFIMDTTFDYEVWNQPLLSYSYTYFNPITMKEVKTMKEALVELKDFEKDKFRKYRGEKTKYVVGVFLEATYMVETSPNHNEVDSEERDMWDRAGYFYDLELDENMEIIGGEWYQNAHPDFLWNPAKGAKAMSVGDYYLLGSGQWDGKSPLSNQYKRMAVESARRGQPLARIVESLIHLSNKENK